MTSNAISISASRTRTWRWLAVLGLVVYTLAFGEAFVRLVGPQPLMPRYVAGQPWGVRGNIAGAHYHHTTPEVSVDFQINSAGMRDNREFPVTKPDGVCRVALFGDSFFMGYELPLEATFAAQLEARLRDKGYNAEVLNFAVSGFGQAEMLKAYEGQGRRYDPDLVIFQFHSSDYGDNVRSGLFKLENGRVTQGASTYLPAPGVQEALLRWDVLRLISDHSQLYALLREHLAKGAKKAMASLAEARGKKTLAEAEAETDSDDIGVTPGTVALTDALMRYSAQFIRSEGRGFMMVGIPTALGRTKFGDTLAPISQATRDEVAMVWPLEPLNKAARPDRKLYYERGHGHLTPEGVQVVLNETMKRLETAPSLLSCRTSRPAVGSSQ